MSKFLDETGLAYFWGKIKDYVSSHGAGLPNGGTTGQYLKKNSSADQDAGWENFPTIPSKVSDLTNDSNFITGMEILSYGNSTWNDFITAYNAKKVVYCRASSNSNPASGSQTRLAFMAYVNNASSPTNVEFQYYRSVNSHSDSQQGDQVYVYKLTSDGTWTVTVRENYTKIVAGTGLSGSYNSGVLTLTNDVDAATETPENLGTAAVGSSSKFAREDHVHNKPTYTKSDVGLENVDNVRQYSASNPPPDEIHIGPSAPSDPDAHVWIDTDGDLEAIANLVYPVGSIYMSVNSTSPATLFGGTWQQIQDTFLLSAGSTYTAGDTGGEETHTLTLNEAPAHTHGRGTMDITGQFYFNNDSNSAGVDQEFMASGAFSAFSQTGSGSSVDWRGYNIAGGVNFKASDAWTGETDSKGGGQAHNNMPPYLVVYMWKRTA